MQAILLITIIIAIAFQNSIRKPYAKRTDGEGTYFFSLMTSLAALLFFIATSTSIELIPQVLPYSLLFSLASSSALIFATKAVSCGPLSLTTLINSYSLILPTLYGLAFLKEPVGHGFFFGLILLAISLFLTNKKSENGSARIGAKWLFYISIAFVGNGMCSVVQKAQQVRFAGEYKSELMIYALALSVILLGIMTLIFERGKLRFYAKAGTLGALACGIANGVTNLFVMLLSDSMPASLMFPLISAGGIVATYFISRFLFGEKLSRTQNIGLVIGIVSIILFNI